MRSRLGHRLAPHRSGPDQHRTGWGMHVKLIRQHGTVHEARQGLSRDEPIDPGAVLAQHEQCTLARMSGLRFEAGAFQSNLQQVARDGVGLDDEHAGTVLIGCGGHAHLGSAMADKKRGPAVGCAALEVSQGGTLRARGSSPRGLLREAAPEWLMNGRQNDKPRPAEHRTGSCYLGARYATRPGMRMAGEG